MSKNDKDLHVELPIIESSSDENGKRLIMRFSHSEEMINESISLRLILRNIVDAKKSNSPLAELDITASGSSGAPWMQAYIFYFLKTKDVKDLINILTEMSVLMEEHERANIISG